MTAASQCVFNFSDSCFAEGAPPKQRHYDEHFESKPCQRGWFNGRLADPQVSTLKMRVEWLYWRELYREVVHEVDAIFPLLENGAVRRELEQIRIRACAKLDGSLDAAIAGTLELLAEPVVELGVRFLAAEIFSCRSDRLKQAAEQILFFIRERPTVYQAWYLLGKILGDSPLAAACEGKGRQLERHAFPGHASAAPRHEYFTGEDWDWLRGRLEDRSPPLLEEEQSVVSL